MDGGAIVEVFAATVRIATPLLFAALGGLISERAGTFAVGVEGMAHAERVGGDPHAEPEHAAGAQRQVLRHHERDEHEEPHHVQRHDDEREGAGAAPLGGRQRRPDPLLARAHRTRT